MALIGKDISLLTQKASVAGTEKLPVSDTEYITPDQILAGVMGTVVDISTAPRDRRFINSSNLWRQLSSTVAYSVLLPVTPGDVYYIEADATYATAVAAMASASFGSNGSAASFAGGATSTTPVAAGSSIVLTMPSDALALYILVVDTSGNTCTPKVYDANGTIAGMIADIETILATI